MVKILNKNCIGDDLDIFVGFFRDGKRGKIFK